MITLAPMDQISSRVPTTIFGVLGDWALSQEKLREDFGTVATLRTASAALRNSSLRQSASTRSLPSC